MVVYYYNIAFNVLFDAIVFSLSPYSCLCPFPLHVPGGVGSGDVFLGAGLRFIFVISLYRVFPL